MDNIRSKLILEVSTEGFWDWNLTTDEAYLSPRLCELIGYSPDATNFNAAFLKKIIPLEDHDYVFTCIEEYCLGKKDAFQIEHRLIASDESQFWVETRGKAVGFEEYNKPVRIVGTVVDITERKKGEEALRESHNLLNNFTLQVPGALFQTTISPDGHVCTPYASEKLKDIYEVSPDQIRNNIDAISERFHPDDRDRIFSSIFEASEKNIRWECEYRVILPRQGQRWLYGIADSQRMNDGTVYFYGIVMDITERRELEKALNHSRKLLTSILDNAPSAFFVKDAHDDFRIIMWNRTAEQIFGIPASAMIGKHVSDIWPAEQAHSYLKYDRNVVASRLPMEIPEEISSHPEKGSIYLHTRKIPLFDNNDDVSHIVVICDDITEQRMMLAEHIKSQKMESLGLLAGGIAHDFNNILTGIIGNISLAGSFLDESHKSTAILQQAVKAAGRATELANQLLTFAKGGAPIKKTVILQRLLKESASFVLHGSNVSYDIEIPDDLAAVDVDEGQISQVVNNLIINATQAMPGGGTVSIKATNTVVDATNVMALTPGKYVRLAVADTGCGIPAEVQSRVFDPYYTTKIGGSGLGLASVQSIITKHGGHIDVCSVVGEGTTFEILLPASEHVIPLEVEAVAPATEKMSKSGFSILVMDDEEIIREILHAILGELGYHLQVCSKGEEAIELYQNAIDAGSPFTVVIMDLTIPGGMGGKEAARQILAIDPKARLIVSSGYSSDEIMADYAVFGFCAILQKPYSFNDIANTLNKVLSAD